MSGERYVPNGVILICTNGANFGFFQVTFHVDTSIYASNMGTEGDRWPILNIPSFGACIATPNVPCVPSPVIWQQPRDGIYINSNQMLLENSTAKCMRGGTVSIQFTFANLQQSPSGSFKRPSEYIKDGFDWIFGKLDEGLADVRAGLAEMGAPTWLQNSVDQLAWNAKMSVGIVEGVINGVVGLGELIWDVANDPVGVGGAIVDSVCDGAKSAWDWASDGSNWTNVANDAWNWASDGKNWEKAASDAAQWLNDNPRTIGNVTGEIALEVGAAAVTGGGSAVASGAKKVGAEVVEQGVKRGLREVGEETLEEGLEQGIKKNLPEVITKSTDDLQDDILDQIRNGEIELNSTARKGNFGEMSVDRDMMKNQGYEPLHQRITDIDAPTHQGIDGVYRHPGPPPKYAVIDSKYGQAGLNTLEDDTRQMSDPWINKRLDDAVVDEDLADEISATGYDRVVGKVDENGNVIYRKVDKDGYIIRGKAGNWP